MLNALSNSLVLLCMIALGYFLKLRGVIGHQHRKLFLALILNVTMPCAIVAGFDMDLNLGSLLVPFFIGCGACLLLNFVAIYATRREPGATRALTLLMTCGFLIAPFSLPFVHANMPYAFMAMAAFDVAQGLFNMGFNYGTASMLAASDLKQRARFSPWFLLKNMVRSGPMAAYFFMLALSALRLPLPGFVLSFAQKVGGANIFLSMAFIGLVLDFSLDRGALRRLGRILLIRYGCALAVAALCFWALPIDPTFAKVITLGLLAPVSNASMAYADRFGCDVKVYGAASSASFVVGVLSYTVLFLLWA